MPGNVLDESVGGHALQHHDIASPDGCPGEKVDVSVIRRDEIVHQGKRNVGRDRPLRDDGRTTGLRSSRNRVDDTVPIDLAYTCPINEYDLAGTRNIDGTDLIKP